MSDRAGKSADCCRTLPEHFLLARVETSSKMANLHDRRGTGAVEYVAFNAVRVRFVFSARSASKKNQPMADKYRSFEDLRASETRRTDYDFASRPKRGSRAVVIAPHGGTIEPGTDKIAAAIAGKDFSFYCFRALKSNSGLHIKSHLFNAPECEQLVAAHDHVISIHGWGEDGERVCVGGLDTELIEALKARLAAAGITVEDAEDGLSATDPNNITNRGAKRRGVQFELTVALRKNKTLVDKFTKAVRSVLREANHHEVRR
jgi:phage replication-related protein YjqB (UPF0714/DUF867 family)